MQVPSIVVFLNKVDMLGEADQELIDLVEMELHEILEAKGTKMSQSSVVLHSAPWKGIPKYEEAIPQIDENSG